MAVLLLSTWLSSGLRSAQSCSSLVSGETIQREMLQSFTSCFAIDMILIHLSLLWFGTSKPKWNLSRSSLNRVMDGYSMLWQEVSECGQFRCTSLVADPSSSRRLDMQSSICSSQRGVQEYVGASQNRRSGTSSGTTPVPYLRSIPPFHTPLKDPFHTSVPYLWSIRYNIFIYILLLCIYIYMI